METREPDEILASDLVEFPNCVVLKQLSEGRLHEFEVQEIARECLVILCIDFIILDGMVINHVRARIEGSLNFEGLWEGGPCFLQLLPSFVLVIYDGRVDLNEDPAIIDHVAR